MLNGIRIYSSDKIWRHILNDLGAVVLDAPDVLSVNLDDIALPASISCVNLVALILRESEHLDVFTDLFGNTVPVFSSLQRNIIIAIYKTGGISAAELHNVLGFGPDLTTHTVDTAISQIRKIVGRDFIQNKNGIYVIGKL